MKSKKHLNYRNVWQHKMQKEIYPNPIAKTTIIE